ncbi:hypothetical protein ACSQ67_023942 [Phaseolus vulgaris]
MNVGNGTQILMLYLDGNRLSGGIPPPLETAGDIPSEFGKLSQLQDLGLHYNHLTSGIPNQFSGVIPQSLGINSSLEVLDISYNHFTGNIPPNLCFGQQLVRLILSSNKFQGGIPPDIGRCTTLVRLRLDGNNFTGPLPHFTSNSSLTFMDLSENNINGAIPSSLGNCTNLTNVILSHNNLFGIIPFELGNLVNLQRLNLSHNKLVGPLPPELSNCKKMQYFDVGFNSLNGSFPLSLRTWTGLTTLNLRDNHFTGGEIPPEIGKPKSLQSLDISLNNLTGKIEVLEDLSSLTELNISYNSFSGSLPDTLGELAPFFSPIILGPSRLMYRMFSIELLQNTWIYTTCNISLLGLVYWLDYKQHVKIFPEQRSSTFLKKVMKVTQNLNDRHIIGRGAHGVIYKVEFDQDNVFVIKKFPFSDNDDRITSMTTEIKTTCDD